jgi:hypothetical protein
VTRCRIPHAIARNRHLATPADLDDAAAMIRALIRIAATA